MVKSGPISFDMKALEREQKEKDEKYNSDLRKKAKKYDELIVSFECDVKSLEGIARSISITPHSEARMGGQSPSYNTGHTCNLEITINPYDKNIPIKKIEFIGWPPLEKDDMIRVYIFKGKEEYEQGYGITFSESEKRRTIPSHLVERDFKETERALKIEKIKYGDVVATYRNG